MEYLAHRFENTAAGLAQKDAHTKQLASQGFRVVSEKTEQTNKAKADKRGCLALIGLPLGLVPAAAPGTILVTYARETLFCMSCGNGVIVETGPCPTCKADLSTETITDRYVAMLIAERKQEAAQRTADINKRIDELSRLLTDSLAHDHHLDWNSLRIPFTEPQPERPVLDEDPPKSAILHLSSMLPAIELLVPAVRDKRIAWENASEENEQHKREALALYERDSHEWQSRRDAFEQEQTAQAERKRVLCLEKDTNTVLEYWRIVLERSPFPKDFPRSYTLNYSAGEQRLIIDSMLPPVTFLPQIGEVRYNPIRNTLEEVGVADTWLKETYEEVAINLALKTIYELFQSDVMDALRSVLFRGHVLKVDTFTSEEIHLVVLSIEVSKTEFNEINLATMDPTARFRRLNGVLSPNLAAGVPINPIPSQT